ncbi:MAG: competence/damage-inducible protein A [Deltaproteobacteria bacterium]
MMPAPTAGILIIGNEILSGKVVDANSGYLAVELRKLGVEVRRVLTIPDEVETIAEAVLFFHQSYDHVFTSGGIGPTHDDVTIAGVAAAFSRPVVQHPEMVAAINGFLGDRVNEHHLKMAEVPQGATLIADPKLGFATVSFENVYILPGVPEILRRKFESLAERFASSPYFLRIIYSRHHESAIASLLNRVTAQLPEVMIGSYPKMDTSDYSVKLTIECKDERVVQQAFDLLLELLPEEAIFGTE